MSDDFYPFVDSGDPAPDNAHITGSPAQSGRGDIAASSAAEGEQVAYATRIAVYDDMLSTPRVIVIAPKDVRTYLEEITNTVYRCMKEQGGGISLMVIREIVENFIHANFVEPIISILDSGNTIRFADQGPGIEDKERAFEFGVTSADRDQKRYIRGTGAGFPMVQQYLENAGGAVSIEDNLHQGTVVTVSIDPSRVAQIERAGAHGGAVRGAAGAVHDALHSAVAGASPQVASGVGAGVADGFAAAGAVGLGAAADAGAVGDAAWGAGATGTGAFSGADAGAGMAGGAGMPYQPAWGYPPAGAYGAAGAMGYPGPQGYPAQGGFSSGYAPQGYPSAQPAQAYPQQIPAGYPGVYPPGAAGAQGWPQYAYGAGGWQQPSPAGAAAGLYVSERGAQAMRYLLEQGSCGPTDLAHALGSSAPTWSRELEALAQDGLVIKRGQKRFLTEMGKLWAEEQIQGQ